MDDDTDTNLLTLVIVVPAESSPRARQRLLDAARRAVLDEAKAIRREMAAAKIRMHWYLWRLLAGRVVRQSLPHHIITQRQLGRLFLRYQQGLVSIEDAERFARYIRAETEE